MGTATNTARAPALADYLHVLHRRKALVLQAVMLVPLAALAFSAHQQRLYRASAQVLLSAGDLASQLTGTQSTGVNLQPQRLAQTQADLARVPDVGRRAVAAVPEAHLTATELLAHSTVTLESNADLLTFHVTNGDPALAVRLVDAYAAAYVTYRRKLDNTAIGNALARLTSRLTRLQRDDRNGAAVLSALVDRQQTLLTMKALQTSNASVVKEADGVVRTQPKGLRNVVLGGVLGIALGIMLAFGWDAVDTRTRNADEIAELLRGATLLGRLPAPDRKFGNGDRLVMLDDPSDQHAEGFRVLRTNLEFVRLERDLRTIMVTSALKEEGKSTTVANLAVALARGGHHVALVDLDLRRPQLHRLFGIDGPGVTEVALGRASLEEALVALPVAGDAPPTPQDSTEAQPHGLLEVLPAG
ncbi:MAG TPA: P-loop NTPase, partial [Gaiellaceae bacterium]